MLRFNTATNPFQKDYAEHALLQKGFNYQLIEDIVQYILRKLPWAKTQPISIMDACCGDGQSTLHLLKELDKNGIQVSQVTGLDISSAQIERANQRLEKDGRLKFAIADIESFDCREEYDVVVSLFGLHWIESLNNTAKNIANSLKPHGLMIFFVPLEKNELFTLRQQLINSDAWREIFKDFNFNPFFDSSAPYIAAFEKHFLLENQNGISGDQAVYFSETDFIKFLSSWLQEVRYLQCPTKADNYLQLLINSFSTEEKTNADVVAFSSQNKRQIRFLEKFFWFHGTKQKVLEAKEEPGKIDEIKSQRTNKS